MYLVWVATSLCRTVVPFIGLFELMKDFFLLLLNIRTTDIDDVMHEGLRAKLRRWWALHRTLLRGQHEGLNCGTCGISDYEVTKDSGHDVRWRHSTSLALLVNTYWWQYDIVQNLKVLYAWSLHYNDSQIKNSRDRATDSIISINDLQSFRLTKYESDIPVFSPVYICHPKVIDPCCKDHKIRWLIYGLIVGSVENYWWSALIARC